MSACDGYRACAANGDELGCGKYIGSTYIIIWARLIYEHAMSFLNYFKLKNVNSGVSDRHNQSRLSTGHGIGVLV